MCDNNDKSKVSKNETGDDDMNQVQNNKTYESQAYKKLNLSRSNLSNITVSPKKVTDGKMLFDRNNKDHRYIVEDD